MTNKPQEIHILEKQDFKKGEKVEHPIFYQGIVTECDSDFVTVLFPLHTTRKFLKSHPLIKQMLRNKNAEQLSLINHSYFKYCESIRRYLNKISELFVRCDSGDFSNDICDIKKFESRIYRVARMLKLYERLSKKYNEIVERDTFFAANHSTRRKYLFNSLRNELMDLPFKNTLKPSVKMTEILPEYLENEVLKIFVQSSNSSYMIQKLFYKNQNPELFNELQIDDFSTTIILFELKNPLLHENIQNFIEAKNICNKSGVFIRMNFAKPTSNDAMELNYSLKEKLINIMKNSSSFRTKQNLFDLFCEKLLNNHFLLAHSEDSFNMNHPSYWLIDKGCDNDIVKWALNQYDSDEFLEEVFNGDKSSKYNENVFDVNGFNLKILFVNNGEIQKSLQENKSLNFKKWQNGFQHPIERNKAIYEIKREKSEYEIEYEANEFFMQRENEHISNYEMNEQFNDMMDFIDHWHELMDYDE